MRVAHYLKHNAGSGSPTRLLVVDTETQQNQITPGRWQHRLWFGWCAFTRRTRADHWTAPTYTRFDSIGQWWEIVGSHLSPRTCLTILSHNSKYDASILDMLGMVRAQDGRLSKAILSGPPWCVKVSAPAGAWIWLDTLNYYSESLASLGDLVGLAKLPMPLPDAPREEWDAYCRRDVEVCMRVFQNWCAWVRAHDYGHLATTRAGQAWNAYRHKYMHHKILVDTHPRALPLARSSYCAGRNEAFHLGRIEGPIYRLDINSQYPAVMRGNLFPAILRGHLRHTTPAHVRARMEEFAAIAEITLRAELPIYPLRRRTALLFPIGEFHTTLAGPELEHALAHDRVLAIHQVAYYSKAELFTNFINDLYAQRVAAKYAGDSISAYNLKLLMNSLYGKFAQRGYMFQPVDRAEEWKVGIERAWNTRTHAWEITQCLGYERQEFSREAESSESVPAVAAYITSYARMLLWGLIERAGLENIFYCDTDSLHVNQLGYERLQKCIDPDTLGALKLEGIEPWIEYHGLKDYHLQSGRKMKGIRRGSIQIGPDEWLCEQWLGAMGILEVGELRVPETRLVIKHLRRVYRKGVVLSSGRIRPFSLPADTSLLPE